MLSLYIQATDLNKSYSIVKYFTFFLGAGEGGTDFLASLTWESDELRELAAAGEMYVVVRVFAPDLRRNVLIQRQCLKYVAYLEFVTLSLSSSKEGSRLGPLRRFCRENRNEIHEAI